MLPSPITLRSLWNWHSPVSNKCWMVLNNYSTHHTPSITAPCTRSAVFLDTTLWAPRSFVLSFLPILAPYTWALWWAAWYYILPPGNLSGVNTIPKVTPQSVAHLPTCVEKRNCFLHQSPTKKTSKSSAPPAFYRVQLTKPINPTTHQPWLLLIPYVSPLIALFFFIRHGKKRTALHFLITHWAVPLTLLSFSQHTRLQLAHVLKSRR